ncbi:hypothetical protein [uncultured Bilophila sp.]|jgi:hypothetical protein|uniref:hypothetical protein n=1 Tax=uncultured Bilophila sp. TaxID=529385 RepID=UPI0025EF8645|nr:hypothetical protein [uncultured Bilophila sp.]
MALPAKDEGHLDAGNAPAFPFTISAFCAVLFSRCVENTYRRQRHPTAGAFLCPFPKVKIFLGCLLGYDCIQCLPGVPDMSKPQGQRRGAVPVAVSTIRHFSLGRMPSVNVENLQELLCQFLFASTISLSPPSLAAISLGFALQNSPELSGMDAKIKFRVFTETTPMNSRQI